MAESEREVRRAGKGSTGKNRHRSKENKQDKNIYKYCASEVNHIMLTGQMALKASSFQLGAVNYLGTYI